jgi:hypothetical protein
LNNPGAKKLRESAWLISAKVAEINQLREVIQVEGANGFKRELTLLKLGL